MTPAETTARQFLAAFYAGAREDARALLDDDLDFAGPLVQIRGADAFLDSAGPLLTATVGHTVRQSFTNGEEVCLIHDVALRGANRPVAMADWLSVRAGRVVAERVFFDPTPLRAALIS